MMQTQQKKNQFFTKINSISVFQKSVYLPLNRFKIPNFISIQLLSFQSFLKEGLILEFQKFNKIQNSNQTLQVFFYAEYYKLNRPKWTPKQAILKKKSYSCELYLPVQLSNSKSEKVKLQWVLFAHLPLMTKHGHFIVNGCPRVLMNQMVRSPGVYFKIIEKKDRETTYCADFIAQRGSWLRLEIDTKKGNIWAKLKKTPKIPVYVFLQALGLTLPLLSQNIDFAKWRYLMPLKQAKQSSKNLKKKIEVSLTNSISSKSLKAIFTNLKSKNKNEYLKTCQKYWQKLGNFYIKQEKYNFHQKLQESVKKGQKEIQHLTVKGLTPLKKPLRPAKPKRPLWIPKTVWKTYFHSLLALEKQIYLPDLKASNFKTKSQKTEAYQTVVGVATLQIQQPKFEETYSFKNVSQKTKLSYRAKPKIKKLNQERAQKFLFRKFQNSRTYDLSLLGRARLNQKLGLNIALSYTLLTAQDILSACLVLMDLLQGSRLSDDIDDLKNRQINPSGNLIQFQLATGLIRFEKIIREKLKKYQPNSVDFSNLFNLKPINQCFREFFGSSPLSQLMDQTNALAEITHKRRLSSLGPGGISRENAGMAIRGIHPTHYGRICPIETPEGQNAGLVNSFTIYSHLNSKGFIETPFYQTYKGFVFKENSPFLFSSDQEENKIFIPGDIKTSLFYFLPSNVQIPSRQMSEFQNVSRNSVHFTSMSPLQMISVATSLIPFLEHNDGNRALMGSNMQRQAVPTFRPSKPIVGTGLESRVIANIGYNLQAHQSGFVSYVDGQKIILYSKKLPGQQNLFSNVLVNLQNVKKNKKNNIASKNKLVNSQKLVQVLTARAKSEPASFSLLKELKLKKLPLVAENKTPRNLIFKKNLIQASKKSRYLQPSKSTFSAARREAAFLSQSIKLLQTQGFLKTFAVGVGVGAKQLQPRFQILSSKYNFQFYAKQNKQYSQQLFPLWPPCFATLEQSLRQNLTFKATSPQQSRESFLAQKELRQRKTRLRKTAFKNFLNSKSLYFFSNQFFLNDFFGQVKLLLFFYKNLNKLKVLQKKEKLFFSKYFFFFLNQFSHQKLLLIYCQNILGSFQKFSFISFSKKRQNFCNKHLLQTTKASWYTISSDFYSSIQKQQLWSQFWVLSKFRNQYFQINFKIKKIQKENLITNPGSTTRNTCNLAFLTQMSNLQVRSVIFKNLKNVNSYSNLSKISFANSKTNKIKSFSFFFWSLYFFEKQLRSNSTYFYLKSSFFSFSKQPSLYFVDFQKRFNQNQTQFEKQTAKKPLQKFLKIFFELSKKKQLKIFLTQNGLNFKLKSNPAFKAGLRQKIKPEKLKKFLFLKQNLIFEFLSFLPALPEELKQKATQNFDFYVLPASQKNQKLQQKKIQNLTKNFKKNLAFAKPCVQSNLIDYDVFNKLPRSKGAATNFAPKSQSMGAKVDQFQFFSFIPFKYSLSDYHRSNQDTYMIHRPLVQEGQWVEKGDTLVDSSASVQGELSIGQNLLIGYIPWEGYNFEDAVLISEKVVFSDFFTSLHIERYEVEVCDTEFGMEQITDQIPNKPANCNYLESNGLAKIGTWVEEGDILVGKIAPRGEKKLTPYENLLYAILDKEISKNRDTSLKVPKGVKGRVIHIEIVEANQKKKAKVAENFKPSSLLAKKLSVKAKTPTKLKKTFFAASEKKVFSNLSLENKSKKKFFNQTKSVFDNEKKKTTLRFAFPKQTLKVIENKNIKENAKTNYSEKTKKKAPIFFLFTIPKEKKITFFFQKLLNKEKRLFQKKRKIYKKIGEIKTLFLKKKLATTFLALNLNKKNAASQAFLPADFSFFNTFKNSKNQKLQTFKSSLPFFDADNLKQNFDQKALIKNNFQLLPLRLRLKQRKASLLLPPCFDKGPFGLRQNQREKNFQKKTFLTESLTLTGLKKVHVYLAVKRKLQIGDKIAGRHGNKGIISNILPRQDMPYLPDGTPLDIVLNPLGVPSRMNVGQIFECLLGLAGYYLKQNYKVQPFDEVYGCEASRSLVYSKLYEARIKTGQDWLFNPNFPGKVRLFDGRSGECFEQPVTVGVAYILKLIHLVDEKIHARSTGPYSLITQQPLRGRSKQGGQRVGEMEVWALEGFGVAYILQEILTLKSDDLKGRQQVLNSILTRKPFYAGIPESFKVLVRELQALCLDLSIYKNRKNQKAKIISTSIDINALQIL
uniref:DNA-directed RNA polymerase subunit beta n=1 Tax=Rhexinema sarcinoideum TaxID=43261 RepID=A0A1B2RYP3_9CHLO|nr:beta subunit of RNA polymerase [Rhexinema sarcinoideum]